MISIDTLGPGILRFDLSGAVSDQDIAAMRGALQPLIDADGEIALLVDLVGVEDLTGAALATDLRAEAALLPYWRRFARISVISDRAWAGNLSLMAEHLLPKLDLRIFAPDAGEAAAAFALGTGPERDGPAPAVRVLDSSRPDLLAFEIDGTQPP